jgi:hypothetical protein
MPTSDRDALLGALYLCVGHVATDHAFSGAALADWNDRYGFNADGVNRLARAWGERVVFRFETTSDLKWQLWVEHPARAKAVLVAVMSKYGRREHAGEYARNRARANLAAWVELVESPSAEREQVLSERQLNVLDAVFALRALAPEVRVTTHDVATRLNLRAAQIRESVTALAELRLLGSKKGRDGGVWLTDTGKNHLERQRSG